MCVPLITIEDDFFMLTDYFCTAEIKRIKALLNDYINIPPEEKEANKITSMFYAMTQSNLQEFFSDTMSNDTLKKPKVCSILPLLTLNPKLEDLCQTEYADKVIVIGMLFSLENIFNL